MDKVTSDILKYIIDAYPEKDDLSVSRLTKILYLADWKSVLDSGRQITKTNWYYNHYGPYVPDFVDFANKSDEFLVRNSSTILGGKKRVLRLAEGKSGRTGDADIESDHKRIVDFVINVTRGKNYDEFIRLVYSTYPVISTDKYTSLDLIKKAEEYRKVLQRNGRAPRVS